MEQIEECNINRLRDIYIKRNRAFKVSYIYKFGWCGFYSDYNNMILNMIWCFENNLKFVMYSKHYSAFGANGWSEIFKPIVPETSFCFHRYLNERNINLPIQNDTASLIKRRIKNLIIYGYQIFTNNYLMKDGFFIPRSVLYPKFRFKISELGINGNLNDACRTFVRMTYQFNDPYKSKINKIKQELHLPKNYAGLHIRRGDKEIECELSDSDIYMKKLKEITDIKNIFVFTDDYSTFKELKEKYTDYNFSTLAKPNENGYNNVMLQRENQETRKDSILRMFASIDILSKSCQFVGTLSSNPGIFLGMYMDKEKIHYIDAPEWTIL